MKRIHRILSVLVCIALLIPTLATTVFAAVPAGGSRVATPSAPAELNALSSYLHASASTEDNTSHLPVNVHTYYDANKEYTPNTIGVDGSVIILYVMNTNTERLGTKSDAELVQSFLDRGYFVIVLDYMNNSAATGTTLDWSVQDIRCQVIGGNCFAGGKMYTGGDFTDGKLVGENSICSKAYILPAGYDIAYNIPYFSYDKNGVAGTFENIVEIWNNDFKSVKRNTIVKWVDENGLPRLDRTEVITQKATQDKTSVDYATWFKTADGKNGISQAQLEELSESEQKQYQYTYIGNTKVVEVTDCVKPDGTMIELNLYFDILYPSDYYEELPVMISMSSSYTRASSWTGETRPYLNGPLFNGYVGVVSDYGLVPMCRNDHYGYFCGDSQLNSVSGDNGTYSLSYYNGIHSDTALLRTLRKIGVEGMDVEGYGFVTAPINPEKIGAYGNSKAGVIVRLANPTPEKLQELRNYEGHKGETRLEAFEENYPYVDPYLDENGNTTDSRIAAPEEQPVLTYSNGQTIHSGLNFVFANCGGASNTLTEGSAPIYGVGTQAGDAEGSYYTYYTKTANLARNLDIPFFGLVAPKIAHDLGYGLDKDYGLDIYESFNRYANYWLKDDSVECIIVDVDTTKDIWVAADVVIDNVYEITEDSSIKLQFTGPVSAYEIEKVRIVSLSTGDELAGDWHGSYGNQQWKFIPYNIQDATYYTVVVPADLCAENGKTIEAPVTHTFRTTSGITENALSFNRLVENFDCVNKGATVARAGYQVNSDYQITSYNSEGFQIDTRAITSAVKKDNDVQLSIFEKIWADRSYIGKTITFNFEAKATEEGMIELALNKRQKYAFANYPGLSGTANLTTEWQVFSYSFVVTAEMYDIIDNTASGIDAPGLSLGIHFYDFSDDGQTYNPAQLLFRNFNVLSSTDDTSLSTVNESLFFAFADEDYSTANDVTLRFAVANNAANTVGIYAADGYMLGEKLGEIIVTGAGIYNFDVTEYIKKCSGAPVVAIKLEKAIGTSTVNSYDSENGTNGLSINGISKYVITNEIKNADGTDNKSTKYEFMVPLAQYVDLNNNLVSQYVGSLSNFASTTAIKGAQFSESDYGRRLRVSFRIYDETSRVFSVSTGVGYNFATSTNDYRGTDYSFYTVAGEWTTITFEFTVDEEIFYGDTLNKRLLYFETENKSLVDVADFTAINPVKMVTATSKAGNYAGAPGLNDSWSIYSNVNKAIEAGKVTVYDEFSYALYIDDIIVEEVATGVDLASTMPMLSITPTTTEDILPTVSASVLSTQPDQTQDGLWISGGMEGFDKNSVKSYVKLSLADYYGGYAAFMFKATSGTKANVSVYGVADVNAGASWNSETITAASAPANDIYGAGVNINAVYGNMPLATFAVDTETKDCLVELTEFADYMLAQGAEEITLILVSDTQTVTNIEIVGNLDETLVKIAAFDGVNIKPSYAGAGFTLDKPAVYSFYNETSEGIMIDLRSAQGDQVKTTSNSRFEIFAEIWNNAVYVGKTIRFSFSAKSTEAGSIEIGLNQRQKYAFNNFPGLAETADLTTSWQTFTYEFVVTQEMYDIITDGNDANGIQPPGLALGIHFAGFNDGANKYKGAQITFRNFVISEVKSNSAETVTRISAYDAITTRPTQLGAGFSNLDESSYKFYIKNSEGMGVDLRTAYKDVVKTTSNTRFEIFNDVWANTSYVGKIIRFSFAAKASENGSVELGLNQRQKYAFNNFPGFSGTADLTTSWQTFTYEFVVTQEMYDVITNGDDANGIQPPGLGLGVHFAGFDDGTGKYKGAQILFRNFVVSTVEYNEQTDEPILNQYDFDGSKPAVTASGYSGSNLWAITGGALEFYTGKITNGNANQNFRISAFDNILGTHTENIGKTFRVIFKAKATMAGRLDLSLNTGTGGAGDPNKATPGGAFDVYPGHTYAFDLTEEYQTYTFTFVAQEAMYDIASFATIQLGVRLFNGFYGDSAYKDATISIDDLVVVEDPYIRSVDVHYDFTDNKPTVDFRGYSTQIGSVDNGQVEISLATHSNQANSGQFARIAALQNIWASRTNIGKTFTISFRAKATESGVVDFAINKTGTWDNYSYGGSTYSTKYSLTTEYQTFTYTFSAVEDMFTTNASTTLDLAFRFYNGFRDGTMYKDAKIYIDDVHVYEVLDVNKTTVEVCDSIAVSGLGNYEALTVYSDNSATGAPKIQKTYLTYDLTGVDTIYSAKFALNLSGANGENVKIYVLSDAILPTPLTYANAPVANGLPAASFVAVNGMNYVDLTNTVAENVGKNIVLLVTIEEPSGKIEIVTEPELEVARDYHNYTSDSQRHPAVAPTYNSVGNVEFYSCEGCDKLYVKNGAGFVEVSIEDVILPMLVCDEHNYVDSVCTLCGNKEAHKCTGGTATCSAKAVCEICGQEYGSLNLNAHAWDDGVATKNPTCTEKGIMTFTCQNDSTHTRTEEIAALGHKYDAVVTAPDCENGGYTTYTCSVCGDSYVTDHVGPLGHTNATPVVENNANPDCENVGGYDIVVYCSVCGDEISRVHTEVPALGHNYNAVVTAPDCENGGYTTYTCTVCGDSYIADATDAIGHNYKSTVIAPDCENSGYTTYVCLVCGDTYVGDEVAALGHTEVIIPGKAPTCTETGLTDGIRCTVCDKILTEQTEIPASGHIDNDKDYMCDVCDEDLCTDHEIEIIPAKAPTCTATGLTEGTKCAICGDIILAQNVVPALGHSYNAVVTAPDCENGGYTTYTCSVCDDSYVADEVAAIGHTNGAPVVENNVNPDCVNSGSYDTVIYCTVCGDEVSRVNTFVPALGHTNGTPVVENNVNPDCVNGGGYDVAIYCTVCNDEVSRVHTDVAALGHNYNAVVTAPGCANDGYTTYTCSACGDNYVGDEVAALGHSYDAVVTTPTCVAAGYTTYTCTGCGDSYVGDEVAALGHDWEEATTEVPKTCKVCGETEGDKLPENVPETDITPDTDPSEEVNHAECKAPNQWEEFLTLLINFFRQLFGLPPKCYCGEEL